MLSDTIKTALLSALIGWGISYSIACLARCRTLYGTIDLSRFVIELRRSLLTWIWSSLLALRSWYPVAILTVIAIAVWGSGLKEISIIALISAIITQHWRYDFPCIPILRVVIGWDLATVSLHRALVLPMPALANVCLSTWGLAVGSFLILNGIKQYGVGIALIAAICMFVTLMQTLRRALALERVPDSCTE